MQERRKCEQGGVMPLPTVDGWAIFSFSSLLRRARFPSGGRQSKEERRSVVSVLHKMSLGRLSAVRSPPKGWTKSG